MMVPENESASQPKPVEPPCSEQYSSFEMSILYGQVQFLEKELGRTPSTIQMLSIFQASYLEENVQFLFRMWERKNESTRSAKGWAEVLGDSLLEEVLDPLFECLTAESSQKIANNSIGMGMEERARKLAEKLKQGTITDNERSAHERYLSAFHFVELIQTRARGLLNSVHDK